ncbi:MAG: toprim domain-containing protein, partial [Candidatus Colwellbacteria bacterium]|nr:toprim domain-containing protein [Candidatus Colwellbacteria bacterium]
LAAALAALKDVAPCARCSFPFSAVESGDELLCTICANPRRQRNVIAIVEKETDMLSLENMKKFSGTYLVLGEFGREGVLDSQQRQRLSDFKNRIKNESGVAEEIILALSPTTIANIEAGLIIEELKGLTKRVTRLARGLPTGGEIEFADEDTLSAAFENRR